MLYILITSKIWLLFSIGLRFQTLWRHFSKFSYLELYLKVFIIKIQIISHPECHAKSALINYHVKNPLFIQKWNKPTSANKSELWRHPDFSSLNNFEWAKFDRNSCHTCIVLYFLLHIRAWGLGSPSRPAWTSFAWARRTSAARARTRTRCTSTRWSQKDYFK